MQLAFVDIASAAGSRGPWPLDFHTWYSYIR